ncbi:leucine-rich repeat extensin-like protein 3 [Iris pallida]|uniref:Leucine-rich repeat extensin-like protein 3 n=1 Tax=Iris pallida TaxID=29817 RepID=A0AAX6H0G8_IRIPA|nr:leucine-rich repeat extensin-like protein 3 [Iris pallida]KAJ6834098.1 leucine-rich repeat extensin-like protein 3 [Iris pallida]
MRALGGGASSRVARRFSSSNGGETFTELWLSVQPNPVMGGSPRRRTQSSFGQKRHAGSRFE